MKKFRSQALGPGALALLGGDLTRTPLPMARSTSPLALPLARFWAMPVLVALTLVLGACERQPSADSQRIDQLELKIQQLEQRFNEPTPRDPADRGGKPPAGPVRSLTYRSGTADDRIRIYWADGTESDLPCTQEQNTLICG